MYIWRKLERVVHITQHPIITQNTWPLQNRHKPWSLNLQVVISLHNFVFPGGHNEGSSSFICRWLLLNEQAVAYRGGLQKPRWSIRTVVDGNSVQSSSISSMCNVRPWIHPNVVKWSANPELHETKNWHVNKHSNCFKIMNCLQSCWPLYSVGKCFDKLSYVQVWENPGRTGTLKHMKPTGTSSSPALANIALPTSFVIWSSCHAPCFSTWPSDFSIFINLATIMVHPKWQRLEMRTYLLSRRPEIWVESDPFVALL